MPVIVVGTEKNFAALRPRLFTGKVSNEAVREVTEAVAAANPHVDLKALEPGTVLTDPGPPAALHPRRSVARHSTTKQVLEGIAKAGADSLEQLVAAARTTESDAAAERKQLAKALDAKDFDAAVRKDKALAADLRRPPPRGSRRRKPRAKQRVAALDEARAAWDTELKKLKSMLP